AHADPVLRTEAMQALCRLPNITETAESVTRLALSDPLASVRTHACRVVGKFKIRDAQAEVARLLTDSDVEVRRACVPVLMDLAPDEYERAIRRALDFDGDSEVARRSLHALKRANRLMHDDLLSIAVASPHDQVRSGAIYDLNWRPADAILIARLLG